MEVLLITYQYLLSKPSENTCKCLLNVSKLLSRFRRIMVYILILLLLLLIILPIYCILKVDYATHTYEYGWFPLLAYMEGTGAVCMPCCGDW